MQKHGTALRGRKAARFDVATLPQRPAEAASVIACTRKHTTACKQCGRECGRPKRAEAGQVGGMVGVGRLVGQEVAGVGLLPYNARDRSSRAGQLGITMRRHAR